MDRKSKFRLFFKFLNFIFCCSKNKEETNVREDDTDKKMFNVCCGICCNEQKLVLDDLKIKDVSIYPDEKSKGIRNLTIICSPAIVKHCVTPKAASNFKSTDIKK